MRSTHGNKIYKKIITGRGCCPNLCAKKSMSFSFQAQKNRFILWFHAIKFGLIVYFNKKSPHSRESQFRLLRRSYSAAMDYYLLFLFFWTCSREVISNFSWFWSKFFYNISWGNFLSSFSRKLKLSQLYSKHYEQTHWTGVLFLYGLKRCSIVPHMWGVLFVCSSPFDVCFW